MTEATRLIRARLRMDITRIELAHALGCAEYTVYRYESGDYDIPKYVWLALETIRRRPSAYRRPGRTQRAYTRTESGTQSGTSGSQVNT